MKRSRDRGQKLGGVEKRGGGGKVGFKGRSKGSEAKGLGREIDEGR